MEILRRATNPWGQDVLIGIAWDLMWAAIVVGVVFVLGHAVYVRFAGVKAGAGTSADASGSAAGVPDKILRHSVGARAFHWLMSAAMIVLLITAFFPVVGIQFPWVTIHWAAGVGLILTIIYHILHATIKQDFWSMWIDRKELKEGSRELAQFFRRSGAPSEKPGKYPLDHKLYHHAVAAVSLGAIATGLLMMVRVDTPFWPRNPYLLSDQLWGVVYVVHGLSGVALITLVMAHIYFAIRPEKWWITLSMINGWIGRKEYLEHHDPKRWVVGGGTQPQPVPSHTSAPLGEGLPQSKPSHD